MNEETSVDLADAGTFRRWERVTIRFSDEDRMGHVNNVAYAAWVEVARANLNQYYRSFGPDWLATVLVRVTIDYLKETSFPGEVRVGARPLKIGARSFESGYGVFRDDVCLAIARSTNVFFDLRSRTSTPPPDAVRKAMEDELLGSAGIKPE